MATQKKSTKTASRSTSRSGGGTRGGKRRHIFAGARQALHHHARLFGIVPEPRKSALLLQACDFLATVIDVQVPLDLAQTRLERLDVRPNNVGHPIVPPGVRGNS